MRFTLEGGLFSPEAGNSCPIVTEGSCEYGTPGSERVATDTGRVWRTQDDVVAVTCALATASGSVPIKKPIDEFAVVFYYHLNTGKEVIENI